MLEAFPEGYALFSAARPDGNFDTYLIGGPNRFRSPNEFIPHAEWLALGAIPGTCACEYCNGSKAVEDKVLRRECRCESCVKDAARTKKREAQKLKKSVAASQPGPIRQSKAPCHSSPYERPVKREESSDL